MKQEKNIHSYYVEEDAIFHTTVNLGRFNLPIIQR